MSDFDLTASRRYRARLAKQRDYQASYRAGLKAKKAPERDDVAKAALASALASVHRAPDAVEHWMANVVRRLAEDGFDPIASSETVRGMIERAGHKRQEQAR